MKNMLTNSFALLALALPAIAESTETKSATKLATANPALTFAKGILTLDIEERLRFEARNNNRDFDNTANDPRDDGWLLNRFRLGLALKPADWLKVYAQMQDTREWFSTRGDVPGVNSFEAGDTFDLRQGYIELGNLQKFPLSLTVGRQALNYGDKRLVGDSVWNNFGRTFDGAKLHLQTDKSWVDAFAVRPLQVVKGGVNGSDSADNFLGIYGSTEALGFQTTDLYLFYRDKTDAQPDLSPTNTINPVGTASGPAQRIATVGTRWKSKKGVLNRFDYSAEFAYQFGDIWTAGRNTPRLDQHAFAMAITGGYTWENVAWKPRVGIEYDYSTGDKNPVDGSSQSFQTLFPSNHAKYGAMDEFAWRNLNDLHLSLSAQPGKNVDLTLDYHVFWLAQTTDYWWTSNGNSPLRTKTPGKNGTDVRTIGASSFAGQEIDLTVTWQATSHLGFLAGYSHFFAGTYLFDTGPHQDADFGYVSVTLSF